MHVQASTGCAHPIGHAHMCAATAVASTVYETRKRVNIRRNRDVTIAGGAVMRLEELWRRRSECRQPKIILA
jgi:hypothetical protein